MADEQAAERRHPCGACEGTFKTEGSLRQHERNMHAMHRRRPRPEAPVVEGERIVIGQSRAITVTVSDGRAARVVEVNSALALADVVDVVAGAVRLAIEAPYRKVGR